ncbi:Dymeclin [Geodia barretti]|uniref:Dymeclin n=1 Tax=Geodia barretti TaxID=519541 RepID=A0AA35SR78_GEOBA|nr:Dymeclin [Geodia barretti]
MQQFGPSSCPPFFQPALSSPLPPSLSIQCHLLHYHWYLVDDVINSCSHPASLPTGRRGRATPISAHPPADEWPQSVPSGPATVHRRTQRQEDQSPILSQPPETLPLSLQDKYLHTNCLAALANMSSHFNSLHLDAAQKIVTLFKQLAKKYHRMTQKTTPTTTPTSATPLSPDSEAVFRESADFSTEVGVVEEILVMILEIVNSCLSHRLATNPHLVYCLLYQREVFSPLHTSPPLMDLVRNILSVVEFFSKKLEESGPSPYSSPFVLETIIRCSATWPHHRLRVFPELKFRYVEEAQPEEFFVPYVWTLVHKNSPLYWQQFHVSSSPSSSSSTTPH